MEEVQAILEEVGAWAANGDLARGALIIGGATLAALGTAWRVMRRRPDRTNVKIDAPSGENVSVKVGKEDGPRLI